MIARFRITLVIMAIACVTAGSWAQDATSTSATTSNAKEIPVASNPDFAAVAAKLDQGGSFYFYNEADQTLETIFSALDPIISLTRQSKQFGAMVKSALDKLGFSEIDDWGMSTMPLADNLVRKKSYLRLKHREGIFAMSGPEPTELASMKFVPMDVSAAWCSHTDFSKLLPLLKDIATAAAGPMGAGMIDQFLAKADEETGLDTGKLLASLGNEWSVHIKVRKDMSDEELADDLWGGLHYVVRLRVSDDSLFEAAKKLAKPEGTLIEEPGDDGLKIVKFKPAGDIKTGEFFFASSKDWLIAANSMDALKLSEETVRTGKNLLSNEEFKSFRQGMPDKVNSIDFAGREYTELSKKTFDQAVGNAMGLMATGDKDMTKFRPAMAKFADLFTMFEPSLGWRVNDPNGILWVQVCNPRQQNMTVLATAGVATAIAVPAFLRARENSRGRACQENLVKIDSAKEQYALEHSLKSGSSVSLSDLVKENGTGYLERTPECPAGGKYTIGTIGEDPKCSNEGPTWAVQHIMPGSLHAGENSRDDSCQENLVKIDGAKEQYALDNRLGNGVSVSLSDLVKHGGTGYLKRAPQCPAGGTYTFGAIGEYPKCSYEGPEQAQHMMP
jgi:hypothetical protein